jgi:branched-chain amino acid transport system ATP-binding protein
MTMAGELVLETEELTVKFGGLVAVDNVNIVAHEGEIVGIIGPNGAGKTTLFNLITGAVPATSGRILYKYMPIKPIERKYVPPFRKHPPSAYQATRDAFIGERVSQKYAENYRQEVAHYEREMEELSRNDKMMNIAGLGVGEIARLGLSRTFQNIRLYTRMTVIENVMTSIQRDPPYSILTAMLGLPEKYRRDRYDYVRAMDYLKLLGVSEYANHTASSLPYGQQRRLEIARAIATRPRLLLLDEPAAGMNNEECRELVELILKIHRELGIAILLIEHHMDVLMKLSDVVYVINQGAVLRHGSPREIQADPEVIRAYLGERRRGK